MFLDPNSVINQLNLESGMQIADIGSGSGFYTLGIAPKISPNGKVYAIDVQRDLLNRIGEEAKRNNLTNIEIIWGDAEKPGGTKMMDHIIDFAVVSNVLFQAEDKQSFVKEIRRILKPEGSVLVIDWADSFSGMGPSASSVVSKKDAMDLFEENGFKFIRDISAGENHYGMILKKIF